MGFWICSIFLLGLIPFWIWGVGNPFSVAAQIAYKKGVPATNNCLRWTWIYEFTTKSGNQIWHKNEQTQVFTLWFRRSWNFWHVLQTKTESISSRLTGIPGNSQNEVPLWPSYQILLGLTIKSTFETITTYMILCVSILSIIFYYHIYIYIYHLVI